MALVHSLERWNSLALILVQGITNDSTVFDLNIRFIHIVLEGKGVLHPLIIVALRIIISEICERSNKRYGLPGNLPEHVHREIPFEQPRQ